jgi:hypothetical protein
MTKIPRPTTHIDYDALSAVLSTRAGRKVIWDILAITGLFHQPFGENQRLTDFNCGRLNTGLILHADCLTVDPDLTATMTKEQGNASRREHDDAAAKPDTARTVAQQPDSEHSGEPDAGLGLDRGTGQPLGHDLEWRN